MSLKVKESFIELPRARVWSAEVIMSENPKKGRVGSGAGTSKIDFDDYRARPE